MLNHRHGTYPISRSWFTISGVGGHGSLAAGLFLAVFLFAGWDATVYVNEEVKHRRLNPGKAAIYAVAILAVIYIIADLGLPGVVSPAKLQANSSSVLVYCYRIPGLDRGQDRTNRDLPGTLVADRHRRSRSARHAGRAGYRAAGVLPGSPRACQ